MTETGLTSESPKIPDKWRVAKLEPFRVVQVDEGEGYLAVAKDSDDTPKYREYIFDNDGFSVASRREFQLGRIEVFSSLKETLQNYSSDGGQNSIYSIDVVLSAIPDPTRSVSFRFDRN